MNERPSPALILYVTTVFGQQCGLRSQLDPNGGKPILSLPDKCLSTKGAGHGDTEYRRVRQTFPSVPQGAAHLRQMGLLLPARGDAASGYRFYGVDQLERARLAAVLRHLGVLQVEIKTILDLGPEEAAQQIADYWVTAETAHSTRRDLARFLIDSLNGRRSSMYEVQTREIPSRCILCLKRNVDGWVGVWALGKEFVALLKDHSLPLMKGRAGAVFCIYWGEISDDSDGPLEWCRPVPEDQAKTLAAGFPELSLRVEPAHREAFVDVGPGGQTSAPQ